MSAELGTTDDQRSDPEYQTQTLQLADGTTATFGPPGQPDMHPVPVTPSGLETPITGRSLRTVPIQRFMQGARQAHLRQLKEPGEHAEIVPPPTGSRSWRYEHFMQVVQEYWQAQADGQPVRQAISERWSVSKVTASRWLRRARELGYLYADHARQPRRLEPDPEADHQDSAHLLEAEIFRKILANLAGTAESPLREKAQALVDAIH